MLKRSVDTHQSSRKISSGDCPKLERINKLINVNLGETSSNACRKILLSRICGRIHRREEAEIRMPTEGLGISPFSQRQATPGIIQKTAKALQRFSRSQIYLIQENPFTSPDRINQRSLCKRKGKSRLAGYTLLLKPFRCYSKAAPRRWRGEVTYAINGRVTCPARRLPTRTRRQFAHFILTHFGSSPETLGQALPLSLFIRRGNVGEELSILSF
mmetsp:Transcript_10326/g.29041  ORF Transcript_10326/g.29041 Transcript_10326/m.29041 type:complete len:215 (+) Transcript_10326:274-918(+)